MTHTTNFKRLVCCLLAVLMLCTCVLRPLEVKAVAISTALAIGAAACLIAATAGVLLHPKTAEQVVAVGEDFQRGIREWGQAYGKTAEAEALIAGIILYDPGDDDHPSYEPIGIEQAAAAGISLWLTALVQAGRLLGKGETAPEGYCYLNGHLVKEHSYMNKTGLVFLDSNGNYCLAYNTGSSVKYTVQSSGLVKSNKNYYTTTLLDDTWASAVSSIVNSPVCFIDDVIWSYTDVVYDDGMVAMLGTKPSDTKTIELTPIIIEEIPTLDDGTPDPDEIEKRLPATLDPWTLLEATGKEDLNDAVSDIMANLANGTMTYDQYMESIQSGTQVEPDLTPDGSGETETATGLRKLVDFFTGTIYVESPLTAINFTGLFDLFPFNIPAGIYQTINFWNADASPPVVELPSLGFSDGKVMGESYTVDFSEFPGMNKIAALIRAGELILFAIGLLLITRKVTKW